MLAIASLRLKDGNAVLATECMETTRKGTGHFT
jgi:hypothetical protein